MGVVDELRALSGCYIGSGWMALEDKPPRVARLVVTPVPGGSGVALDYEVVSIEGKVLHREHSMLVAPRDGVAMLLVAHAGDERAVVLREVEPGLFAEAQSEPYREGQMAIRIETTHGGIRHAYCWAGQDGKFAEVDVAEVRLTA